MKRGYRKSEEGERKERMRNYEREDGIKRMHGEERKEQKNRALREEEEVG